MSKPSKPIIHARDHEHGGADPVRIVWESTGTGGGPATGAPLIIDYFDNDGAAQLAPASVWPVGSTTESQNWAVWVEEANWSGYNTPEPWIAVDDVTTGSDITGPISSRWVYLPNEGTDADFVTGGGSALVKVEFSMQIDYDIPGKWWDVAIQQIHGAPAAWDSPSYGIAVNGNYGWRSDFPVSEDSLATAPFALRRRASLAFYQQLSTGVYTGFGAQIKQSLPGGAGDFNATPYCQLTVTLLKNDAFAGERGG